MRRHRVIVLLCTAWVLWQGHTIQMTYSGGVFDAGTSVSWGMRGWQYAEGYEAKGDCHQAWRLRDARNDAARHDAAQQGMGTTYLMIAWKCLPAGVDPNRT